MVPAPTAVTTAPNPRSGLSPDGIGAILRRSAANRPVDTKTTANQRMNLQASGSPLLNCAANNSNPRANDTAADTVPSAKRPGQRIIRSPDEAATSTVDASARSSEAIA